MKTLSDEQLKQKLGEYIAPQGLYQKTKNMTFLGKVTCNVEELVAGSWHDRITSYNVCYTKLLRAELMATILGFCLMMDTSLT